MAESFYTRGPKREDVPSNHLPIDSEVKEYLEDNIKNGYQRWSDEQGFHWHFENEEDLIAFKLRWYR